MAEKKELTSELYEKIIWIWHCPKCGNIHEERVRVIGSSQNCGLCVAKNIKIK